MLFEFDSSLRSARSRGAGIRGSFETFKFAKFPNRINRWRVRARSTQTQQKTHVRNARNHSAASSASASAGASAASAAGSAAAAGAAGGLSEYRTPINCAGETTVPWVSPRTCALTRAKCLSAADGAGCFEGGTPIQLRSSSLPSKQQALRSSAERLRRCTHVGSEIAGAREKRFH